MVGAIFISEKPVGASSFSSASWPGAHINPEGHDEKVQIRRTLGLDSHGNFGGGVHFRDPGGGRTILR
jgi:hypothetical protein